MSFTVKSVRIDASYTLLCAAAICVISGIYKPIFYGITAIAVHEAGHLLAMFRYGYFPKRIKISLFAIHIADDARHTRRAKENFFIIFFGPAANFICVFLFYLLYLFGRDMCLPFVFANASVGLLNSLPVMSLDGGQLLYLLLCRRLSGQTAERVITLLTLIMLIPLAAFGFVVLFQSPGNFSLLFVCGYLLLSLLTRENHYY